MNPSSSRRTIRIATRASNLALWQANHVSELLQQATHDFDVEIVPLSTLGDRDRVVSLQSMGGQGVFTREVQRAVLDSQADLAVHSLKDLPTETAEGLVLAGVPSRAERYDVLIFPIGSDRSRFEDLTAEDKIGTGSPRRRAQLLSVRPELQFVDIRGNIETRLRKLDEGTYDAIILAAAGLNRLGYDRTCATLKPPLMLPAVGQAALGIECRSDDAEVIKLLQTITDPTTLAEVSCERACLAALQAGCHAPVGVHCLVQDSTLQFSAVVLSPDGSQKFSVELTGQLQDPVELGIRAAQLLIKDGASAVL